ncbi:hypothetical protein [Flavobacterium sp.]|uniref:hypothetical protein n=1 Tax=Flavobacterium sp. TaxID=239 RepID=UPI0025BFA2D0|nr:hypothetical protein [Flavobacterium sp.]MBA4275941.1 hypothetical protein [Flavobacterium sp.]
MSISIETAIHTLTRHKNIQNIEVYNQFINWLKGEFDLYLMEELDGLKVYYPNGLFSVILFSKNEKDFSIEIKIMSKTLKTANQMAAKIETIYCHLNKVISINKFKLSRL